MRGSADLTTDLSKLATVGLVGFQVAIYALRLEILEKIAKKSPKRINLGGFDLTKLNSASYGRLITRDWNSLADLELAEID